MAEAHAVRFDDTLNTSEGIILDAMRCWRDAKDNGEAVQPCVYRTLARHRLEILAPVFDSLMTICEAAMKRSIIAGEDGYPSSDETALIDMLLDPEEGQIHVGRIQEDRILLNCALRSTRLMMEQAVTGVSTGRLRQ
ncbi:hypothetical protein RM533_09810 [Croceicoccus sp. F390]|uniref:Uncharacterized protein n=1 Tax=Croceicoccus esteveae TaxID=3075597 RepID=A0ABU2ZKA3_9SPHN|nr:hypothetical protein [Croceicoccus sp. F390]MDT0576483.1 hypothetical protein [Croceicoccus sp. F390]